ncbi:hypothetical protein [Accumulibacter sp.]|uniref:hypothetical protein n=1 Tax=Accumulibacter sp. TaxID=2053492 RepID=UPI0028C404D3|nr:hypothetical protein [Accumulibacter sp.]
MRTKIRRVFRDAATVSLLVLLATQTPAAQETPANVWHVENATISTAPSISEFVGGEWVPRMPAKNGTLFEVQGTLKVEGDGSFGPLSLADIRLLSGTSGVPAAAELVAVGVRSANCKYFSAQSPVGDKVNKVTIKLNAGGEFALTREVDNGPLLLKTSAPSLDLCMAFELSGTPPAAMVWRMAGQSIPLAVRSLAPTFPAGRPASWFSPQNWRHAISSPLLWGAAALMLLALVGAIALHRARRQRARGDRPSSDPGSALDIQRVGSSHQPITLTPVGPEAGPGRQHFHAALAALRLGEWTQANELFSKAIEAGLTPTYEAGAWSLRGDAMLNCDDLLGAATCFLRSLSCSAVTTESVLLSAGHLAAIYRELGFRRDAGKMEKVKLLASPFGSDLGPQRHELIARLANKFKHKRRARMLARLNPFA